MQTTRMLLPEWVHVDAVLLAWPHTDTDWAPWLDQARATYLNLIAAINRYHAGVIILCAPEDVEQLQLQLPGSASVLIVPANYNDTWIRDYGFLSCGSLMSDDSTCTPVEFSFNGWGQKFVAKDDNQVNQKYLAGMCKSLLRSSPVVAEGGALEIDDHGRLLTTAQCLLNPKRNGDMSLEAYRDTFTEMLGCREVIVLENGHLEGDDTDGHIDTLVRFTPDNGLVIQAADNRPDDSHYASLCALCEECARQLPEHHQYRLPLPDMRNNAGERLPASYANFLICNRAILLPVYGQPEDAQAIEILKNAYPNHVVEPIDCAVLVQQFGSLHCISMQVPGNTLKDDVLHALKKGVSIYATNLA